jgi:hypothetical protein
VPNTGRIRQENRALHIKLSPIHVNNTYLAK